MQTMSNYLIGQTNLFVNGSLETWTSSGTPNTTPDYWVNCSTDGIAVDCVPVSCNALPAIGSDGGNYARGFNGEGFSQEVQTVIGASYTIEFDYCGVSNCFGGLINSGWNVEINGVLVHATPILVTTSWQLSTFSFIASTSLTSICFRRIPLSGSGSQGGIDNLKIFQTCNPSYSNQTISICESYVSPSGNYTWTTSGQYHDTLTNSTGCDSILSIDLFILNQTASTQFESAIDSYWWPVNGQTYSQGGDYTDTIVNAAGCDSIVTLNLTLSYSGLLDLKKQTNKKLVKITDLNGRDTPNQKNTVLLFIYEDGTVERVYEIE
jgi:hypothetical protein